MNISVIVPTVGRPEFVLNLLECLNRQSTRPTEVIISAPESADVPDLTSYEGWAIPLVGTRGLTAQRNAALRAVSPNASVILFFDDDVTLSSSYVHAAASALLSRDDLLGVTGTLLMNGAATGTQIGLEDAHAAINAATPGISVTWVTSLYGCNFGVRASDIRGLEFDERLPLYGWLEDADFSGQLASRGRGRFAQLGACVAVHHGSPSGGRTQHLRYGYSQLTNPVYLMRKGTLGTPTGIRLITKPVLANFAGSLRGLAWRRARLLGNLLSAWDLIRGRLVPERITQL